MSAAKHARVPKQSRSKETKQRILHAGLRIFSKKGYYLTNSKQIARAAGVSTGSFYMYFTDKKALFKEVMIGYQAEIKRVLRDINIGKFIRAGNVRGFLRYLMKKLMAAHDIHPEFHQEFLVLSQSDAEIKAVKEQSSRESVEITKRLLSAWGEKLRVDDIEAAAVVIQRTTEEIIHTVLFSDVSVSRQRLLDQLTDMQYRYLVSE